MVNIYQIKKATQMKINLYVTVFVGSLLLLSAFMPLFATANVELAPRIHVDQSTSSNWSGYDITGVGLVTDVKGTWTVPAATGTSTNTWSSFWVGIDGDGSNTVEQIGTDSDWQNGKSVYYAWYEFYPKPAFLIKTVPISPGDTINAEVKYSGNRFTVTLSDLSTHKSYSNTAKIQSAKQYSAEWIAEAPWSGGVLPLTNFGTVTFTNCATTISGNTGTIGSFPNNPITMTTSSGLIKAQPSSLSTDGTSFSITWVISGP